MVVTIGTVWIPLVGQYVEVDKGHSDKVVEAVGAGCPMKVMSMILVIWIIVG